jgi:hypothetical protein
MKLAGKADVRVTFKDGRSAEGIAHAATSSRLCPITRADRQYVGRGWLSDRSQATRNDDDLDVSGTQPQPATFAVLTTFHSHRTPPNAQIQTKGEE